MLAVYPVARIIRLLATTIGVSLIASAIVAILLPKAGTMTEAAHAGTWIGVYGHKSQLGMVCIIGVLCFGWIWRNERKSRWRYALLVLFCIFMSLMARSRTAQLSISLIITVALFLPLLRRPGLIRLWAVYGLTVTGIILSATFIMFFDEIMEALGKDASLTGRLPTWAGLISVILDRPFGGYGYYGFFRASNADMQNVWRQAGWTAWSAHSGYIEVMLSLGLPGLALSIMAILELIYRSSVAWTKGDLPWASFALLYTVTHLVINAADSSTILRSGDMISLLLVVLLVGLRLRSASQTAAALTTSLRPGCLRHPFYERYQ
jgi:exopolysaccharide production protein ExoQ